MHIGIHSLVVELDEENSIRADAQAAVLVVALPALGHCLLVLLVVLQDLEANLLCAAEISNGLFVEIIGALALEALGSFLYVDANKRADAVGNLLLAALAHRVDQALIVDLEFEVHSRGLLHLLQPLLDIGGLLGNVYTRLEGQTTGASKSALKVVGNVVAARAPGIAAGLQDASRDDRSEKDGKLRANWRGGREQKFDVHDSVNNASAAVRRVPLRSGLLVGSCVGEDFKAVKITRNVDCN